MSKVDLDLDLLKPEPKKVRLNGKEYDAYPPSIEALFSLMSMKNKLDNIGQVDESEVEGIFNDIKKAIATLIPGIEDEQLNLQQLFALIGFINELAVPADIKAMEAKGIKLSTDQKKILSTLEEKSLDSSTSIQATE